MSRQTVRGVAALGAGVLLALTGCSAGQLAETSRQNSTVDGTSTNVGDLSLRDVTLAFPAAGGAYQAGDDAQLLLTVTNQNPVDSDRLVSVSSDAASGAQTDASPADVTIPAGGSLQVTSDGPIVELTGLRQDLQASVTIPVTFTFARAGAVTLAVPVGVPLQAQERTDSFDFNSGGG